VSARGRICFHSDYLYPVLVPSGLPFSGGAEMQLAKLARGLIARGFEIGVVTCDFGQPPRVRVQGMDVYRTFRPQGGIPVLRFFHPRLTRIVAALQAADAEVYYVKGGNLPAGITYDVARWRKAGFVNHVASDWDVERRLAYHFNVRDRWWYLRALRGADARLAQTEYQQRSLAREFGVDSEIVPNLVEIPERPADAGQPGAAVWLGTYKGMKRPEWFTALAAELPAQRFVMAGVVPPPPLTREPWEAARTAARARPNLEVRGHLNAAEVAALYRDAALLVHTSPVEGFSNVLLEAWAAGIPTVSSVDPDGVVAREGLGAVATDYPTLVAEVRRMLADPEARRAAGARARAHAIGRHAPDVVCDRLAAVLDRVVAGVRQRRAAG
jgi:glycosyltransferase involved in cell wall biosynthesis